MAGAYVRRAHVKYYVFFNLLKSPNEHPNVDWVNLAITNEKIYVHICAHCELMETKYHDSESCILQGFLKCLLPHECI